MNKAYQKWARSRKGLLRLIYNRQKRSSKTRGHTPPDYTFEHFKASMEIDDTFILLYLKWARSGFKKELRPSIDRINDNFGYSFLNIRIVTWGENNKKSHTDMKKDVLLNGHKAVLQFSKEGEFIEEYSSQTMASKKTGVSNFGISKVCRGERKTAGGFIWKLK